MASFCTPTNCYVRQGETVPYCPEGTSSNIRSGLLHCILCCLRAASVTSCYTPPTATSDKGKQFPTALKAPSPTSGLACYTVLWYATLRSLCDAGELWRKSCLCTHAAEVATTVRCQPQLLAMSPNHTMSLLHSCMSQVGLISLIDVDFSVVLSGTQSATSCIALCCNVRISQLLSSNTDGLQTCNTAQLHAHPHKL